MMDKELLRALMTLSPLLASYMFMLLAALKEKYS
jgi:hypothetical protein